MLKTNAFGVYLCWIQVLVFAADGPLDAVRAVEDLPKRDRKRLRQQAQQAAVDFSWLQQQKQVSWVRFLRIFCFGAIIRADCVTAGCPASRHRPFAPIAHGASQTCVSSLLSCPEAPEAQARPQAYTAAILHCCPSLCSNFWHS